MKVRKTVKKIVALGVGATMVGATLLGAAATDLGDFPKMFIDDEGRFDGLFVYGAEAASSDVGGLTAITNAVQTNAKKSIWVPTGTGTVTVEGGVQLVEPGDSLLLGQAISASKDELDKNDLDILKDGSVRIGTTSYTYTQVLNLGNHQIKFDKGHSDFRDPVLYVDMDSNEVWTYELDFSGTVDFEEVDSSRTIEILGKAFTIDPNLEDGDALILYGSDITTFVELGVQKEMEIDGVSYTLEIVSASEAAETAHVSVNGEVKSVKKGDVVDFASGDLEIYVEDLFISNIPTLTASANLFVGSQKIEFPATVDDENNFNTLKVNGNTVHGVEALVYGSFDNKIDAVEKIKFKFIPRDMRADDRVEYLLEGESLVDPVFGTFEVNFVGPNMELTSEQKSFIEMQASNRAFELDFVNYHGDLLDRVELFYLKVQSGDNVVEWSYQNNNRGFAPLGYVNTEVVGSTPLGLGDEIDVTHSFDTGNIVVLEAGHGLVEGDMVNLTTEGSLGAGFDEGKIYYVKTVSGNNVTFSNDYNGVVTDVPNDGILDAKFKKVLEAEFTNIKRDRIFALNQGGTTKRTKLYEVISISTDSSDQDIVTIRDLATGIDTEYREGGKISGATITGIDSQSATRYFNITASTDSKFYIEGGKNYIDVSLGGNDGYVHYREEDVEDANEVSFLFKVQDDSDDRLEIRSYSPGTEFDAYFSDDNNNRDYGLSVYGTFVELDIDNRRFAKLWTPKNSDQELSFNVFVNPVGAGVSATGQGYWETEQVLIPGTRTVMDSQVSDPFAENLIVIGGPCANTVSSALLGNPENCVEGFVPGRAKIKLFDDTTVMDSGKLAILVAGYTAEDTTRAAYVLNEYEDYAEELAGRTEVEVTGTTMADIEVGLPTIDEPVEEEDEEDDEEEVVEVDPEDLE